MSYSLFRKAPARKLDRPGHQSLWVRTVRGLLCLGTIGMWLGAQTPLQAQKSPEGIWGFSVHGPKPGVAVLIFSYDPEEGGTIIGHQITTYKKQSPQDNPRGFIEDPFTDDRTGLPILPPFEILSTTFGGAEIEGWWVFDERGRVTGAYAEVSELFDGESWTPQTNEVSFTATVKPGKKLTMRAYSNEGKLILRGYPTQGTADASGHYQASGKRDGVKFLETFDLLTETELGLPNTYTLSGRGAAYDLTGGGLASPNRRVALLIFRDEEMGTFSSVAGKWNSRKGVAKLKGWSSADEKIGYKAVRR